MQAGGTFAGDMWNDINLIITLTKFDSRLPRTDLVKMMATRLVK
jgi:hypothetical protein